MTNECTSSAHHQDGIIYDAASEKSRGVHAWQERRTWKRDEMARRLAAVAARFGAGFGSATGGFGSSGRKSVTSTPAVPISPLTRGRAATVGAVPVAPPVAAPPVQDGSGSDAAAAEESRRAMPTVDIAAGADGGGEGVAPQQQERDVVVAAAEAVLKAAADPTIMLTPRDKEQARRDRDEMERDCEVAP